MIKLKNLISEGKYKFLGTCDRVRAKCQKNEDDWHIMMAKKKKITTKEFLQLSDLSDFLDDDESPIEWIHNNELQDSSSASYKSIWNNKPCTFYQTAGFEFIFVK